MTHRILLLALASLLFPPMVAAQGVSSTASGAPLATRALPAADSLALAALAAIPAAAPADQAARAPRSHAWVRTAKWSLLAAAAGFGAYALANSHAERTDRRAQVGIIGGQISLLGSVGLFIFDLRRDSPPPQNIPFEQPGSGATATAVTTPVAPR